MRSFRENDLQKDIGTMAESLRTINTEAFSEQLRRKAIDFDPQRILVTNFRGSEQEPDLSEPANCEGFGRVRHFRRATSKGWPANPLPIDPACKALGLPASDTLRAQAFQNAACNWRCWYCFVPFDLLSANPRHSELLSPAKLLDLYLAEPDPPKMIDLTGGQPDLVPEWVPWMMRELISRGIQDQIYLWSDDNLSNDYFWRFLTEEDRKLMATYPNYGRVCCFKGFNETSFTFNTLAEPSLFHKQFEFMERLCSVGFDIYAYATFTSPSSENIAADVRRFVDRLQQVHPNLPLRLIPLEIQVFSPVKNRLDADKRQALKNQWLAIEAWQRELEGRFGVEMRSANITEVSLN
ncbi:MAG: hypothetical protein QOD84_2656 [Acidobacteriaceae bacterium]